MKYTFVLLIMLLLASACAAELSTSEPPYVYCADGINLIITAPDFINGESNDTKSDISTFGTLSWTTGDKIGLFSNQKGSSTQTPSQLAFTLSAGEGTSAAYSTTTGWTLVPGETFNYFSYYPYSETNSREQITIDYTGQTQTANNATTYLGAYDYMYSDMATATSSSSASFSFHHLGSIVNVNINVPAGYEDTTFYKMRLYADEDIFVSSATYSVDDVVVSGVPVLDKQTSGWIELSFGDKGIKPTAGIVKSWFMMVPAQWNGKTITAKLYVAKNNVSTLSGSFSPSDSQTSGQVYTYNVTSVATGQYLPDKPAAGEQLHILLFGHSYGTDCTLYLSTITHDAGITNIHYGRFYQANCSLSQHWDHVTAKDAYNYYDSVSEIPSWEAYIKTVDDVLAQYPWDIILFQQSIGFSGEGDYSSYQPYLNNLTEYVTNFCENVHDKTPIIGWNMFWGFNEGQYTDYDRGTRGALAMYQAIVQAAKDMTADNTKATPIPLIVPVGTALQNARNTSLNDPGSAESPSTTKLLTRDGFHASYGIGRYVTACTWFQYLIAPIYGTTITGNSYRPTATSFEKDLVTDERAALCWQCAIEAVKHPYEVTPIVEGSTPGGEIKGQTSQEGL